MRKKTLSQRATALLLVICLILSYGSFGVVNAAAPPIPVSMNSATINVGETTTLDVSIGADSNVAALQLVFKFDPTKVKYKAPAKPGDTKGAELKAFELDNDAGSLVVNENDAAAGQITIGYMNLTPLTFEGSLFRLSFEGLQGVTDTPVDITVKEITTDDGSDINTEVTKNGAITVNTPSIPLTGITLDKDTTTISVGKSEQLQVAYSPATTTDDKTVSWQSSDTKIATVDNQGNVTAIASGTATITATVGRFSKTCTVTVPKELTGISINETLALEKGKTEILDVTYLPADATDKGNLAWSSSDYDTVTVEPSTGEIIALKAGQATITATVTVGEKEYTDTCEVKVTVPLTGISLDVTAGDLTIGGTSTQQLTVIYDPADTTDAKDVSWTTSNDKVATVSETGLVTAVGAGNATITAMVGNKTATYVATVKVPLKGISLDKTTGALNKNASEKLTVSYDPAGTTDDKTVSWTSSDPSIAAVDKDGNVTGIKAGTATITATVGEKTATCAYTISEIHISEITLGKTAIEIKSGKTETLAATILPVDTTDDKTITWSSSNEDVATVAGGVVTAKNSGTATITATAGGKTTTCVVTVPKELTGILIKDKTTLEKGANESLVVTYQPADADNKGALSWTSSDSTVATVDANGKVMALKTGQATITATTKVDSFEFKSTCAVTVIRSLTKIELDKEVGELIIGVKKTEQLKVSYTPSDTTDSKVVTWTSSDDKVATVNSSGFVTAVGPGNATITATVGNLIDTYAVTVKQPLTGIGLNKKAGELTVGVTDTQQLEVTYTPENTTDAKDVTWTSSADQVATVSSTGLVTAKGAGTATITAKVGTFTASYLVTVKVPLVSIALNKIETGIKRGETEKLTVIYNPTDTTDIRTVTWESSNKDVATVDGGVVTGVNLGKANITATVGGKTATCEVEILPNPLKSIRIIKDMTLIQGDTSHPVKVTYDPAATTDDKTVAWTSSNTEIATVDDDGKVKAEKEGTARITAKSVVEGIEEVSCDVTVKPSGKTVSLTSQLLDAHGKPMSHTKVGIHSDYIETTTDANGYFTFSNVPLGEHKLIVKNGEVEIERLINIVNGNADLVDEENGQILVQEGVSAVTVTLSLLNETVKIEKIVEGNQTPRPSTPSSKPLVSIGLSKTALTINEGSKETLTVSYNPVDTTSNKAVTWTSSDDSIATVNAATGEVTAVKAGIATITAKVGDKTASCEVTVKKIQDDPVVLKIPNCSYQTHVQNVGWQGWKSVGESSGTSGQSLRLEGIQVKVDSEDYDIGVEYQTHVQNIGWQGFKNNGETSGTYGQSLRLEGIQLKLTGADADKFDIYYQVHAQNYGWLDWAKNGESAGTEGFGLRLEAIKIQVVLKGDDAPGLTDHAFVKNQ